MGVVWVLKIDHRHGSDTTVHESADAAKEALVAYVHEWWDEVAGFRGAPETPPDGPDEVIDAYFEANGDREWYSIDEAVVNS